MTASPVTVAIEFASLLEQLGIEYALGGSVASSLLGEPRTALDVDFAVRLNPTGLDCEKLRWSREVGARSDTNG